MLKVTRIKHGNKTRICGYLPEPALRENPSKWGSGLSFFDFRKRGGASI